MMLSPRAIKSNRALIIGLILFFFCNLYVWPKVESSVQSAARDHGYKGPASDLKVLDLRFKYSPATVKKLFDHWQPAGCRLCLYAISIDVFVFFPGYGLTLLVLMNRLGPYVARHTGNQRLRNSYVWVLAVLAVDLIENIFEYLLLTSYMRSHFALKKGALPDWWDPAARVSSLATTIKWCLVFVGLLYSVVLGLVAGGIAAGFVKQRKTLIPAAKVD